MEEVKAEVRSQVGTCKCGGPVMLTPAQHRAAQRFGIGMDGDGKPAWEACDICLAAAGSRYRAEAAQDEATRIAKLVRSRMTQSRMPEHLLGQRVPGTEESDPEPERLARLAARRWAADVSAPPMLLLWGDKGRGKTVLAASAFAHALRRRGGYWAPAVRLLRDVYGEYGGPERERAEQIAQGRTMVVLDDLDKVMGERSGEQLFNIVDALYSYGTPCIVTMNGTPDDAAKRWGSVGPMIADRLAEAVMGEFHGPSWRRQATRAAA